MNTKILIFFICFLTTESISSSARSLGDLSLTKSTDEKKWSNPQLAPSRLPNPLTPKYRIRRMNKLVTAQVQALRNSTIINYPVLFANKKYKILKSLVYNQANDLEIPHKRFNYLINFNSNQYHCAPGTLQQNIARCYGKYSDYPYALPECIRNHLMYARYNQEEYDSSSSDDD